MKTVLYQAKIGLLSATALLVPSAAMAQSSGVEALLEEIVIVGTKKAAAENVQEVPIAVTAYGDVQLEALKVKDLQGLSYSIPNVSLDDIGTFRGTANFSIRGLGINSSIPSIDPAVGVFVDGVYLGINQGVVFDIFDLESIEILRGPQGILFGRNVTGGAVVVNTKRPTQDLTASAKASIESGFRGTEPTYTFSGSVSGPIIEDKISVKLAAYYNKDEGYHKLTLPDGSTESFGVAETIIVRPAILFTPNDRFDLLVRYEHGDTDGDGPAGQNHTNGRGQTNPYFSPSRQTFDFSIDEPGFSDANWDQVFVEANLDVDFGDGRITNVFGWRDIAIETLSDIDATPLFLFHAGSTTDQDQVSNELRYNGRFFDWLDVTTGLYFFTQDIAYNEIRNLLGGLLFQNGGGVQDQKTYGVFSQFDIDISPSVTLNIGGRYAYEKKEVVISTLPANPTPCDVRLGTCSEDFTDQDSWENFSPKIGVQWAAAEDVNVYANWTRGFRAGGYNFRNTNPAASPGPFDDERVDAFEIGLKTSPVSQATLNTAIFYNDVQDLQRELNLADPISGVQQVIRNTADATIWGFEIEGQYAITENLLIRGSLGHTDGEYDNVVFDLNEDGVVNQEDEDLRIPRLAKWTYGAGFLYSHDFADVGDLDLRLDYFHRASSAFTDSNFGVLNNFDSLSANATLRTFEGRVAFSIYGKNLLHDVQFGGDTQLPPALGPVPLGGTFSPLGKGRVIGFEVKFTL